MRATLATSSVYLTFIKVATKFIVVARGVVRRRLHVPDTVPAVHEGRAAVQRVVAIGFARVLPFCAFSPAVAHMSSSRASSLADRLVTACYNGDLPSAKAAVAGGASVNEKGTPPGWDATVLPLQAAVFSNHHDVVVWLLSHGADPNGDIVMCDGAVSRTIGILQLLIDAGGDVNRTSNGLPPLFWAVDRNREDNVRVLLAQPSLGFAITYYGKTPERYAHDYGYSAVADMIAQEVSGEGLLVLVVEATALTVCAALLWLTESETSDAGANTVFVRLVSHVLCGGHEQLGCDCGVVGSRQSSGVARWRLLSRRAWHDWCVAYVVVTLPGTHHCCVRTGDVYGVVLVAWSGRCGSRGAAKSSGA